MIKSNNPHLAGGEQHKMKKLKNLRLVKTADSIPQVCCPRFVVVQCVIMFHEDNKTL